MAIRPRPCDGCVTDTVTPVRYVQAPQPYEGPGPVLFLAGAITGCPDWQAEIPLAVGADPACPRRLDVEVQLGLARPGLIVHDTLAGTVRAAEELSFCGPRPMSGVHEL